jgi:hypothetical protein
MFLKVNKEIFGFCDASVSLLASSSSISWSEVVPVLQQVIIQGSTYTDWEHSPLGQGNVPCSKFIG